MKSPLVFSEKSIKILENVQRNEVCCYMLVNGDSLIDRFCVDYYKSEFVKVKTGIKFKDKFETYVMGDVVMQVYLPLNLKKLFVKFYKDLETIKDLNMFEFFRDVYQKEIEIKVVMYKNKSLAEFIRNEIINEF